MKLGLVEPNGNVPALVRIRGRGKRNCIGHISLDERHEIGMKASFNNLFLLLSISPLQGITDWCYQRNLLQHDEKIASWGSALLRSEAATETLTKLKQRSSGRRGRKLSIYPGVNWASHQILVRVVSICKKRVRHDCKIPCKLILPFCRCLCLPQISIWLLTLFWESCLVLRRSKIARKLRDTNNPRHSIEFNPTGTGGGFRPPLLVFYMPFKNYLRYPDETSWLFKNLSRNILVEKFFLLWRHHDVIWPPK